MLGIWWAGAEPDVKDVGAGAKGYSALALQHGAEPGSKVVKDILAMVHDKGQGSAARSDEVGSVLYMRGLIIGRCWASRACARRRRRFGKGKVMTGEQVRWGLENLNLDQGKLDEHGLRRRDAAGPDLLHRPHGLVVGARASPGTAASGRSAPTGTRPTTRCCARWSRGGCRSTPPRRASSAVPPSSARGTVRRTELKRGRDPRRAVREALS